MNFNQADIQAPISHFEYVIDESTINQTQLFLVRQKVASAMDQLTGWCTVSKAFVLMDLIFQTHAKTIVEIGVWGGKSLIPMAFALKELNDGGKAYGIDPWNSTESAQGMEGVHKQWWEQVDHTAIYLMLVHKIKQFHLTDYAQLLRYSSKDAPEISDIDLLHIDDNHSEEKSLLDVLKWVPLVKSGGIIVFDDVNWKTTGKAVKWLDDNCIRIANYHEICDWSIWIKP